MALIELTVAADIAVQLRRIADALDRAIPPVALQSKKQRATLIAVDPEAIALAEEEALAREERGLKPGQPLTKEPDV